MDEDGTFKITDASGNVATVTKNDDGTANVSVVDSQGNAIASLDDGSGNPVNITFTSDDNYVPGDDEITINTQLGEVLLGENVYNNTYTNNSFSVQYDKSNFKKGDVNPTMYFDCVDNVTGIVYQKKDEDIEYNVNFTQKLKVNTQASESFNIYLGRNVDDIMAAVQNTIDIENQIKKVESMKMRKDILVQKTRRLSMTYLRDLTSRTTLQRTR